MQPTTTEDILELLDGYVTATALGTAMELGIFWLLAEKPMLTSEIAQALNIPLNRCHNWLQLLCKLNLLENTDKGFTLTNIAQKTILSVYSQEAWSFLARENRYRLSAVHDLTLHLCKPLSTWEAQNLTPPNYFQQILVDPDYAARFTRLLYEIHTPLAEQLGNILDLQGCKRLMDLGGGSGVVSFALLRKYPEITSVVVDVENVCQAGRVHALENGLEKRVTYLPANFLQDELPAGFDMVILCDVGSFSETFFRKIHNILNPHGQLVIIDQFALDQNNLPSAHLVWGFLSTLENPQPNINFTTSEIVQTRLRQAGFCDFSTTPVPYKEPLRWNIDWTILEARK